LGKQQTGFQEAQHESGAQEILFHTTVLIWDNNLIGALANFVESCILFCVKDSPCHSKSYVEIS
jgi:hypothetical protein